MGSGASIIDPAQIDTSETAPRTPTSPPRLKINNIGEERRERREEERINTKDSPHSHRHSPHSPPRSPHSPPHSPHSSHLHKHDKGGKSNLSKSRSKEDVTLLPSKHGGDLIRSISEGAAIDTLSIFEEPIADADLQVMEYSYVKSEKRPVSRNIVTGEVHGNLLQAQFSMKFPGTKHPTQHNEYLLQKSPIIETNEGNNNNNNNNNSNNSNNSGNNSNKSEKSEKSKLHATKLTELRKSMVEKLSDQLHPPPYTSSVSMSNLQAHRKSGSLETHVSLPNLSLIPPILSSSPSSSSSSLSPSLSSTTTNPASSSPPPPLHLPPLSSSPSTITPT